LKYDHDITFQSGQFVILDFGHLDHQFSTRSYSIADYTTGPILELCIVLKSDGAATPLLFNMKIGDTLQASLPQGRFVLPEALPSKPICFICTGTGVAPFRAMVKELLLHKGFNQPIYLFFGCRTQADILYRDEFETLAGQFSNFKYIPVLSRESWEGARGYVHPYYLKVFKDQPDALFYLCGWTVMLKETRDNLKALGYTRADIKVEFYD
jgi:ferredoxin-NADP reductase